MDEPVKKRKKSNDSVSSDSTTTTLICEMLPIEEIVKIEPEDQDEDQIDRKIEEEEKKGDNLVIKDLMGPTKPEPMKVSNRIRKRNVHLFVSFVSKKLTVEERRVMYDSVYSKLLVLLERCQKYVHHLNTKVKQSIAEHQKKKSIEMKTTNDDASIEDDMKRTGLLKKYYEMKQKDIQTRQPKMFKGILKPCKTFSLLFFLFIVVVRL